MAWDERRHDHADRVAKLLRETVKREASSFMTENTKLLTGMNRNPGRRIAILSLRLPPENEVVSFGAGRVRRR